MTDSIIRYNFESNHAQDESNQIWLNGGPVVCRREDFLQFTLGDQMRRHNVMAKSHLTLCVRWNKNDKMY